ncbi:hypothetical protein M9H77_28011 [Catharanthus roseus]|uniref:Uncharacterized protein n=1 Tax=Catharanthus roseus TaxID=4058 RepID=A0ACC0AE56_CATRO|nr:hypothetical protein M9H77_28011 [Catharanthus roseus]
MFNRRRPQEHVPNRGTRGVKRGARRQAGRGAGAFQSLPSGSGTSQTPPPPCLEFASFHAPYSTSFGFSGFLHPLLRAQSERANDMDGVKHYGFGHRVDKKTMRSHHPTGLSYN